MPVVQEEPENPWYNSEEEKSTCENIQNDQTREKDDHEGIQGGQSREAQGGEEETGTNESTQERLPRERQDLIFAMS